MATEVETKKVKCLHCGYEILISEAIIIDGEILCDICADAAFIEAHKSFSAW